MIEVNKNTLPSVLPALGKLICRTSPMFRNRKSGFIPARRSIERFRF